ncbi:hypothetical protein LCGC14_2920830 [marine sediment metagenome]|uniref:Uncharacterized protein n=1 Tax=marine sediment metagenome TaxID=412755 RepID=A0A0F8ZWE6_9ZZZZ
MNDLVESHAHWRGMKIKYMSWDSEGEQYSTDIKYESVLSIKAYSEPGAMAPTIWFEITNSSISDGSISYIRVNGIYVHDVAFVEDRE